MNVERLTALLRKNRHVIHLVALSTLILSSAVSAEVLQRSFTVAPDGEFLLTADRGSIRAVSHDDSMAKLVVELSGVETDAFELDTAVNDNRITATGKVNQVGDNVNITYTLHVPHHFNMVLDTGNGDISVTDIDGRAVLRTGKGGILLKEFTGEAKLASRDNNFRFEQVSATIEANSY